MKFSDQIILLKEQVIHDCTNPNFIHSAWYVEHHLSIVETITLELLERYPQADADICLCMVWLHDYGKILKSTQKFKTDAGNYTLVASKELMRKIKFDNKKIETVLKGIELIDNAGNSDLSKASIEVQIVSSADGASHFIGPFFPIFWHENPNLTIDEIILGGKKNYGTTSKAEYDFKKKIILKEVKEKIRPFYEQVLGYNSKRRKKLL